MLPINNYESLAGKAAGLEEASFELRVAIKRLFKNIKSESTAKYGNWIEWNEAAQKSVFPHSMERF